VTPENTARRKIPAGYESVVSFFNHSELAHINKIAIKAGATKNFLPFTELEHLPADNGERFFSEYLSWMKETKPRYDILCRCLCKCCGNALIEEEPVIEEDEDGTTSHCYPNNQMWMVEPAAAAPPPAPTLPPNQNSATSTLTSVHQQPTVHPKESAMANEIQQRQAQAQAQAQHDTQMIQTQPHQHHQWHQQQQQPIYFPPMTNQFTTYSPWMSTTYPIAPPTPVCTTLKATGLLSCL